MALWQLFFYYRLSGSLCSRFAAVFAAVFAGAFVTAFAAGFPAVRSSLCRSFCSGLCGSFSLNCLSNLCGTLRQALLLFRNSHRALQWPLWQLFFYRCLRVTFAAGFTTVFAAIFAGALTVFEFLQWPCGAFLLLLS